MKLLVLGGTVFVGRHVVDAALAAGHEVTTFHRGVSSARTDRRVTWLRGDRDGDVSALEGRRFDAVIDCSGYMPAQLERTGEVLSGRVGHYLFVSTRSVYRAFPPGPDVERNAALLEGDEGYGAAKARSEEAIEAALLGRVTIVRPGLIVGPYDPTGRFPYWPLRIARGDDVLVPGRPGRPVQFIDARDLAAWCIGLVARPPSGVYDVVGPSTTMGGFIATVQDVVGGDARLHWISDETLLAHGVAPWTELPLWIPESDAAFGGLMCGSDRRAMAAGLAKRPIAETVRDTYAWASGPDALMPRAVASMTPAREQELLAAEAAASADLAP